MRLTQEKIHALAEKVVSMLKEEPDAELLQPENQIELAVAGAIAADLRDEDELDLEVDQVMEKYQRQIEIERMDIGLLRRKIKLQMARERGFKI